MERLRTKKEVFAARAWIINCNYPGLTYPWHFIGTFVGQILLPMCSTKQKRQVSSDGDTNLQDHRAVVYCNTVIA